MRPALLLALPALLAACGASAKDTAGTSTGTDASADGAALYATYCASCHGASGQGTASAPGLDGEIDDSDAELRDTILNGDGSMPPVPVPDEDLPALIAYLRATFG